jgi:serine/threonine protein kinase
MLARLTHPNIARLIDAGIMPDGQPYLVLEYVRGENAVQARYNLAFNLMQMGELTTARRPPTL